MFASRRRSPVFVLLAALFIVAAGCQKTSKDQQIKAPAKPPVDRKPATTRALILGDSLAAGFGARNAEVTPAGCLRKITGAPALVRAVPGATTHEILQQVKGATGEAAALVFLSAGGNDVLTDLFGSGFPEEESLRNFEAIAAELGARKTKLVYLLVNPPIEKAARLARLGRMAENAGFIVVDGMKGFWGDKELMSDPIHPNDTGYAKICSRIAEALKAAK